MKTRRIIHRVFLVLGLSLLGLLFYYLMWLITDEEFLDELIAGNAHFKGIMAQNTFGPRREHFIRTEADYSEAVLGLWEISFTSDDPEYESSEPYRELYRADGTCSYYDLIDGQWVEEETVLSEYFADGTTYTITAHLTKVLEKV